MLNVTEHGISTALKAKMLKNKTCLAFKLSYAVFFIPINVKVPTITILAHMSMINVMLSRVEYERNLEARSAQH